MKQILITGASKGIGLAIARRFYQAGYKVIVCARGETALKSAKAEMPNLITYACDLSDKNATKAFAATIIENHGRLDILVNNAGVFQPGQLHTEDDSVFETMISTNLNSAYYLTKALLPPMLESNSGTIINMCSIASFMAYPNGGAYSVSKFALYGFSKSLREELKPKGIQVISILPGATMSASWDGVDVEETRLMPAEDIAEMIFSSTQLSDRTVVEDIVLRPQLGDL